MSLLKMNSIHSMKSEKCKHILVYYNELPIGTGRIRFVDGTGKLERICILKTIVNTD